MTDPQSFHDHGFLGQGIHAHGTRACYRAGCSCLPCRAAEAAIRAHYRAHAGGDPWIDAAPVRAHLLALQRRDIGTPQAAKLSGVSRSVLQAIRSGARTRIRQSDACIVLAIPIRPAGGICVSAWHTKRLVRALLDEGFTTDTLRRRLGLSHYQMALQTTTIRARTAQKVRRLYRLLKIGDDAQPQTDAIHR